MGSNSVLKTGGGAKRLPVVLTPEEQAALLTMPNQKAPTGLRNYAMLCVFLNAGLRISEALALKATDIDWISGKLDIRAGKGGRDRVLWLNKKTGHSLPLAKDQARRIRICVHQPARRTHE